MKTEWKAGQIGDVCTVIAGQSPKGSAYNDQGVGLPFYQGKKEFGDRHIGSPTTWTSVVTKEGEAGDILMSVRAPVGPINEATQRICIGRGLAAIRANDSLDRNFLWYALLWLQPKIKGSAGAVFDSINKAGIESLPIPLPPLEEQQRIVAILDEAFEGLTRARTHAEANLQNARELSEASVDAIFERLPNATPVDELQNFCTERGITYGVIKLGEHKPDGVPCLRTSNVRPLHIDTEGMKWIAPELSDEYRRTILEGGEVLVNVRGTLGGVATVPEEMVGWNISREVAMVPVDQTRLDPDFASFFISTRKAQNWLTGVVKGAAYKGINLTDLRLLRIPVPTLEVQNVVIEEVKELRQQTISAEAAYKEKLSKLYDLRQSLLQKAFAGELT